jgi:hypothetical protein
MEKIIEIANKHKFEMSEVRKKGTKNVVVFTLTVGKDKYWAVPISFDGTPEGLVRSMNAKLDSFPSNSDKYEKFIDLYWDLWEIYGEDELAALTTTSVADILAMLS